MEVYVIRINLAESKSQEIKIPVQGAASNGLRPLADQAVAESALGALKKPRREWKNWNDKKNGCQAKIKSGALSAVAEVVRDLHLFDWTNLAEGAHHKLYRKALHQLVMEISLIRNAPYKTVAAEVMSILPKAPATPPSDSPEGTESERGQSTYRWVTGPDGGRHRVRVK